MANIKVSDEPYEAFKKVLGGRFIGKTLDALMEWYIQADPAERDMLTRGGQSPFEKRLKKLEEAVNHGRIGSRARAKAQQQ